jgi:hypothetical protein
LKRLLLFSLTVLTLGCNESRNVWNELSQAEKDELQRRYAEKCNTDKAPTFATWKRESNLAFTSGDYARNKMLKAEFKATGTTYTSKLQVWRQTPNDLYFLVFNEDSGTSLYFLRINRAQNEAIINDLQQDHCKQYYDPTNVGSSGPFSATLKFERPAAGGKKTEYTDAYSMSFSFPAYFLSYHLSRTEKLLRTDGTTESTKSWTSARLTWVTDADAGTLDPNPGTYAGANFCTVAQTLPSEDPQVDPARYTLRKIVLDRDTDSRGFRLNCQATLPGDWTGF